MLLLLWAAVDNLCFLPGGYPSHSFHYFRYFRVLLPIFSKETMNTTPASPRNEGTQGAIILFISGKDFSEDSGMESSMKLSIFF